MKTGACGEPFQFNIDKAFLTCRLLYQKQTCSLYLINICVKATILNSLKGLILFDFYFLHLKRVLGQIFISKLHRIKLRMTFVFENYKISNSRYPFAKSGLQQKEFGFSCGNLVRFFNPKTDSLFFVIVVEFLLFFF